MKFESSSIILKWNPSQYIGNFQHLWGQRKYIKASSDLRQYRLFSLMSWNSESQKMLQWISITAGKSLEKYARVVGKWIHSISWQYTIWLITIWLPVNTTQHIWPLAPFYFPKNQICVQRKVSCITWHDKTENSMLLRQLTEDAEKEFIDGERS